MHKAVRRRDFIGAVAGAAAAAALGRAAWPGAAAANGALDSEALREGLYLLRGAGANVLLHLNGHGATLVDSGAPEHSAALLEAIADLGGQTRVRHVFNTQWHPDHTGGNDAMAALGARIIAHENTRLWMRQPVYLKWEAREYPARTRGALPTDTFVSADPQPGVIRLSGERVEYGALRPAHTDGDIYVRFVEANVIAAGRVVTTGYPVVDYSTGGWLAGMIEALDTILGLADERTVIVPGEGAARSREQVVAQREMLATVLSRIEERMRQGYSVDDLLADGITAEFDADWGDPDAFMEHAYHSLWWRAAGTI